MSRQIPWLRVLVEGLVIVGSILLAFGIDAWWDGLEESRAERVYVARIVDNLRETQRSLVQNAEHYEMLLRHGEAVLPILTGREPIPADTLGFLTSVLQVSRITEPVVAKGAYDDLISTGNLRVIRSDTLRSSLSRFYANVESQLRPVDYGADQAPYRAAVRGVLPVSVQLLIRESCLDDPPLSCKEAPVVPDLANLATAVVAVPGVAQKLNLSQQAVAIRLGFVWNRGGLSGGFGVVSEEIDALLRLLEAQASS